MNETLNRFLLAEDKFMPVFIYSTCGPFPKSKERIQKFKETEHSRYIFQNELGKACLQHDMAYGNFKDLNRRTASNKILRDKAINISKNPKYDGNQRGLVSMIYKKLLVVVLKMKICLIKNQKNNYTNQLFEKFKKRKVYSSFVDNIWYVDLANMQLVSKFNKGIRFLLCVFDIFSKYARAISLKDKKGITITDGKT